MNKNIRLGIRKFFVILIIVFFLIFLVIVGVFVAQPTIQSALNQTNTSLITIEQKQEVTNIDQSGQTNFWDVAAIIAFGIIVLIGIWLLLKYAFKFFSGRRAFSDKNKLHCEKKAYEELLKRGYNIGFPNAKWSKPSFGGDEEKNPYWAFIFYSRNISLLANIKTVSKYELISCFVDSRTLRVWNESKGKDSDDLMKELHEQRFGKISTPDYPVKTEKAPSFQDLFAEKKTSVNVQLEPGEDEEET